MRANRDRLELAIITSIILHIVLIGLFVLSSWFTKTQMPSAGGNGGDSDTLDAVMVDTAQVAAEYGNLLKEKNPHSTSQIEKISHEETKPEPEVLQPNLSEISQQQVIKQQIQQQKLVEQQRQEQEKLKILQRQREQAKKQEEETRKKAAEVARLKAEAEAKRLEAVAKQAEEDRKAKELAKKIAEQKRLEAQQAAEARAKAEREEKLKEEKANAEKEAQLKAEQEAKAEKEAKLKAEREAKLKAEKEAKAKAAAHAKAKAEVEAKITQAKKNKILDDFLSSGDLSSKGGNVNSAGSAGSSGKSGSGQGVNVDGNAYQQRIKRLIQSKYRIDPSFSGKQCDVKIFLSRDGTITNYQVLKGDRIVCDAAVSAIVATRKVPPAPSDAVYNQYKSPVLGFSLKVK